jgi:hypothetical protein
MLMLNFQFWEGDKDQAMELARLIADIEPSFRGDVEVMFTARFDCRHDIKTIEYVSKKFKLHKYTTTTKATGWPYGCNRMFSDSYQQFITLCRNGSSKMEACLFIESDCVPLHKDWINMLAKEFKESGKMIGGAWLKYGDAGVEHINGNCIIHKDFWIKNRGILNPPRQGGWDATCANIMLPNAYPSRLIWSDYHLGKESNPWRGCEFLFEAKSYGTESNALYGEKLYPVWLHGPKDMRGIECARQRLLQ